MAVSVIQKQYRIEKYNIASQSVPVNNGITNGASGSALSQDGYTAIGVVGTETSNWGCVFTRAYAENNRIYYSIRNFTNSAVTTSASIHILYERNA